VSAIYLFYDVLVTPPIAAADAPSARKDWVSAVAPYKRSRPLTALSHIFQGLALLALCWFAMIRVMDYRHGWLPMLLLAIPAGALLVKLFAIQHDCGHGSLFESAWANDLAGGLLSFVVMTPNKQWAKEHAKHHATSGNLDFRGIGDVDTWTVNEYKAAKPWARFWYRVYRHPLFLFGPGATGYFYVKQRWAWYQPTRLESQTSVWTTNAAIAAFLTLMCKWVGMKFLAIHVASFFFGSALGTWIFYIGHQFDYSYWEKDKEWDFFQASMQGASYYDVPWLVHYFTSNIGYHHIHHLCSKVPFYNLPRCHEENDIFHVKPIKMLESLPCAWLGLWDEDQRKMVRFSEVSL
jgi:acyl-lipid omega-6 desaturase (Delta-12 desaturase)